MHSNNNTRHWALTPELQDRYDKIVAETRRLQAELGITPRTLEQRHQDYLNRLDVERRQKEELAKINSIVRPKLGIRRP